ncbi:MAG: c-type cytochrome [Planctomycetales bacterium]|nr:c-type cytochrome [Planctomycetales bacterium]
MRRCGNYVSTLFLAILVIASAGSASAQTTLETDLKNRDRRDLAKRAHLFGDAQRGAIRFYQVGLSCVQCHTAGEGKKQLGPDLSQLKERATYAHVIESILEPSKEIQPGYRAERLLIDDGRILVGIVSAESDDDLTLVIPGEDDARSIKLDTIEARSPTGSIMPGGLINQLSDETDFYDLVCFIVELGKAGPENASSLRPDPSLIRTEPLPEYENDLDHRGLIAGWNDNSFKKGKKIYEGLCINCHGTREEAGSLPNALRFAREKFKQGSDPLTMYKTLTHGYKMMLPQRQLVPSEKYDVIHYIREAYLKPFNDSQYTPVDKTYLASLPQGRLRGPAPNRSRPWSEMDYGPFLTHTYEIVDKDAAPRPEVTSEDRQRGQRENRPAERTWPAETNFAYKGIAIKLDSDPGGVAAGSRFVAFEHDTLRIAGAWSGKGFIDWEGVLLDGKHWRSPRTVGDLHFENLPGPGWANPVNGSFHDTRQRARDGQAYGPFPREWMSYKGLYKHGDRVVLSYSVGDADILESHRVQEAGGEGPFADDLDWVRTLNVGRSSRDLAVSVAPDAMVNVAVNGPSGLNTAVKDGNIIIKIPASMTPVNLEIHVSSSTINPSFSFSTTPEDLRRMTVGGPAQWATDLVTEPARGDDSGPLAVDELDRPVKNPWNSRLRMSGLDFHPDGTMLACCCDGDVWRISGFDQIGGSLRWRRIASGLFHPLGLKIIDGRIFVGCRDQIVVLNDVNDDGETDFYQCFNHDHQVTEHFHEFAMGLQSDADGNLYYAKSARHAQDSLVPQHGTLLKVSADGSQTTILANGFRAANGVCLNPDGTYFVTDQEGHWTPMNRINRVVEGGFYGNMYSFGAPDDSSDSAMQQPLCWPNKPFDRSPSELLWIDSDKWGALNGGLLSLSYGYGKVFVVPHERVGGNWQGGMCRLPLPEFETGIMRGRFHSDGHLYVCGMSAWGSNQTTSPGGLYRIRVTGKPMHLPAEMHARKDGITLRFSDPVDTNAASDPENYMIETWDLSRTANYGSDLYHEKTLEISSVTVDADGRTVHLQIPDLAPTWTVQIAYKLRDTSGKSFGRVIQGTIHELAD